MSGDSRTEKVHGYCDHGCFAPENMPENVKCWLDNYVAEIDYMDQGVMQAPTTIKSTSSVIPFIKTHWDQSFNKQCPQLNDKYCYLGSMAVAMAQVMYYYKRPIYSSTVPSYTTTTNNISVPYLYGFSIDWDAIQAYVENDNSYHYSADAINKLMRYCAQISRADFDTTYTAASDQIYNFVKWASYSTKARMIWRTDYSQSQWENFIQTELQAKRPVLYTAVTPRGDRTHSFLCDGYDGNGYYHFNWGLGGLYDGYYALSALNPTLDGQFYDMNLMFSHRIAIGLEPNTISTNEKNSVAKVYQVGFAQDTYTRNGTEESFHIDINATLQKRRS